MIGALTCDGVNWFFSHMNVSCLPPWVPLRLCLWLVAFNFVWPLVAAFVAWRRYVVGRVHAAALWGAYALFGWLWCQFGEQIVQIAGRTMP